MGSTSRRLARVVARRPRRVIFIAALTTALAMAGIVDPLSGTVRLRIDPALNELLPDDDSSRAFYESLRRRFGSDDMLVVALEADDLFTASVLRHVVRLTRRIESLDGVERVDSLATTPHLRKGDGDVDLEPILDRIPETAAELSALRESLLADPLHAGRLVSRDGRVASLIVHLEDVPEDEFIERALDLELARIAREVAEGSDVWLAGTPHVKAEMSRILVSDLAMIVPGVLLLMLCISRLTLRTWSAALVPIGSILVALVWTLGAMAWTGHALNIITTIVPPLVLIIGFAYTIHVVTAYRDAARTVRKGDAKSSAGVVQHALERVSFPVLLTGVTTIVGFGSLSLHPLPVIRDFGLYAALGVACALASALLVAPAIFAVARHPRVGPGREERRERRIDAAAERLARFDLRHRWLILFGGGVALVASFVYMTRIVVNTEIIGNFEPDAPVRMSYEAINASLDGANPFYVVVESGSPDTFKEPRALAELAALQRWLEAQPEIGGTTSLADFVMQLNQAFEGGDPAERRLPPTRADAAQLLFLGATDELDRFVDPRYGTATVMVRSTATQTRDVASLVRRIETRLSVLPSGWEGQVTGNSVLLTRASDDISRGQALSLGFAFVTIYVALALYFGSFQLGLLALIPNVLPVAVYFGTLGLTGITLNNATALMGCIVLGIAVDDTIHFLVHFREEARRHGDEALGAIAALRTVGRPVTYTTVVLCLGLLLITTSDLKTQAQFGALGAFTLAVAWFVDVVLTPALCSVMSVQGPRSGAPWERRAA